jgi:nucleoside-diphosphate-sugar epimerase
VGDTARLIAAVMGRQVEIETDSDGLRPQRSEVERLWADNTKAERLLGWRPEYGGEDGFRRGLTRTVEWFTRPENLRTYKSDLYNI